MDSETFKPFTHLKLILEGKYNLIYLNDQFYLYDKKNKNDILIDNSWGHSFINSNYVELDGGDFETGAKEFIRTKHWRSQLEFFKRKFPELFRKDKIDNLLNK